MSHLLQRSGFFLLLLTTFIDELVKCNVILIDATHSLYATGNASRLPYYYLHTQTNWLLNLCVYHNKENLDSAITKKSAQGFIWWQANRRSWNYFSSKNIFHNKQPLHQYHIRATDTNATHKNDRLDKRVAAKKPQLAVFSRRLWKILKEHGHQRFITNQIHSWGLFK